MVTTFTFKTTTIRTALIDNEPWFVATDVCSALGLSANVTNHTVKLVRDEEVRRFPRATFNRIKAGNHMVAVNESGLYKLIMRSDKKEALEFQHRIASEVLPSIRKTGKYDLADHGRDAMPLPVAAAVVMAGPVRRWACCGYALGTLQGLAQDACGILAGCVASHPE